MSRSRSEMRARNATRLLFAVPALWLSGCFVDGGEYRFGEDLTSLEFQFFDEDEGVFPSNVTLLNPNNPFTQSSIRIETAFEIYFDTGGPAGFYAWATVLTGQPEGQWQWYTALSLVNVLETQNLSPGDQDRVRELAINAFQSVLDNFPDSETFDNTGEGLFRLVPSSYFGIIELGGTPLGDWVVVQEGVDDDGEPIFTVVSGAGSDRPRVEFMDPTEDD